MSLFYEKRTSCLATLGACGYAAPLRGRSSLRQARTPNNPLDLKLKTKQTLQREASPTPKPSHLNPSQKLSNQWNQLKLGHHVHVTEST